MNKSKLFFKKKIVPHISLCIGIVHSTKRIAILIKFTLQNSGISEFGPCIFSRVILLQHTYIHSSTDTDVHAGLSLQWAHMQSCRKCCTLFILCDAISFSSISPVCDKIYNGTMYSIFTLRIPTSKHFTVLVLTFYPSPFYYLLLC